MKNNYMSVIVLVIIASLFLALMPSVNASPAVTVSSYKLTPSVLMPGENGTLEVTIYNAETTATSTRQTTSGGTITTNVETSGATITRVWVTTVSNGNKEIIPSSYYDGLGKIAPGASMPLTFKITVDKGLTEDWYFPKVKVNLEAESYEDVEYPITIRVSNKTVELIDTEVPSTMYMSGATEITLTVVNNFEAGVDAVTVEPAEVNGIEIYPKRVFVGTMDSDSHEDVSFSVNPLAEGIANLSFVVNYKNGQNDHSSTLNFSMNVIDSLDVAPVIYSVPSMVGKGVSARIRLEVYNAKSEEISGVIVSPIDTNLTISPSQYFIGSMDPDDVFSASFEVDTSDLTLKENYSIDFKVTFKQGENYYETPSVNAGFMVVEPTAADDGMTMCYTTIIVIVVAISLIILFFFYRKRRKGK
jgi:hypothetical protein